MNKLIGWTSGATRSNFMFHVLALAIVAIWGITFGTKPFGHSFLPICDGIHRNLLMFQTFQAFCL